MSETPNPDPSSEGEREKRAMSQAFLRECGMLFTGVFIGFIWSRYFERVGQEAHIIVLLLHIILCMARYMSTLRSK
ncbi:hypothetical protein HYR69_07620 [Candidatus Sumerlaeota bacterium]|nr:hypothetical protein [Candidatus Sumerlaeota bacterium]